MTKKLNIILLILLTFVLSSCAKNTRQYGNFSTMGSSVSVEMDVKSKQEFDNHYAKIKDIFNTYHQLATNEEEIKTDMMNVYQINKKIESSENKEETIQIKKELYDIIQFALDIENKTTINGQKYLNISMGNIIDEWKNIIKDKDELKNQFSEKTEEEFNQILIDKIKVTKDKVNTMQIVDTPLTLSKTEDKFYITIRKGVKIDLGAIAKGYALEVVRKYLIEQKVTSYNISAGSSSIILGSNYRRKTKKYVIGMVDPVHRLKGTKSDYYALIQAEKTGVTTSGNYEQYIKVTENEKDIIYHHIISPITKIPMNYYYTVSILMDDVASADALTTAMFNMPQDVLDKFIKDNQYQVIYYTYDDEKIYKTIDEAKYHYKQED